MIHTWSCSSTHAPMVQPKSQLLGSGFGQSGSTSNIGALTLEPCASALYCRTAWPAPRAMIAAASAATETNLRSYSSLVIVASRYSEATLTQTAACFLFGGDYKRTDRPCKAIGGE